MHDFVLFLSGMVTTPIVVYAVGFVHGYLKSREARRTALRG